MYEASLQTLNLASDSKGLKLMKTDFCSVGVVKQVTNAFCYKLVSFSSKIHLFILL